MNEDGIIGFDTSKMTDKSYTTFTIRTVDDNGNDITVEDSGDILATDDEDYLYIKKSSDGSYLPVIATWGGQADFDESDYQSSYSFVRESQYVEYYESPVDNYGNSGTDYYYLAVRVNNTDYMHGSPSTNEGWDIYKVSADGIYDENNTIWGVKIKGYEQYFGQDIDGDGFIGVNTSSLDPIETDTSTSGGILKRGDGSLFISDGSQLIQIKDDYGYSDLEYSAGSWEGGTYSSTGYAVERQNDGSYLLAILIYRSIFWQHCMGYLWIKFTRNNKLG